MSKQLQIGVVGTSGYADWMHLRAITSHPHANLAAICGRNRDRAQELAEKYDIAHVFTDYHQMIGEADLDVLAVVTPDDLHFPVTMMALDSGLHVLCEKTLALTVDQAKKLYVKAEEVGVKHMTYFTWRWWPPFQYLHRLIQEGFLGQQFFCEFRYLGGYGRTPMYQWKWDRRRGLGSLGDLGSHMIDMAHWMLGDIVQVSANLETFIIRPGPEGQTLDAANDSALLTVKFQNGCQGVINVSAVAHLGDRGQQFQIFLYGEDGTLELESNFEGYTIRGARSDEEQIRPLAVPDDILQGIDATSSVFDQFDQIFMKRSVGTRLFIDAIVNDLDVRPSFYDGLKAQTVIDAAIESDQSRCWVDLKSR